MRMLLGKRGDRALNVRLLLATNLEFALNSRHVIDWIYE